MLLLVFGAVLVAVLLRALADLIARRTWLPAAWTVVAAALGCPRPSRCLAQPQLYRRGVRLLFPPGGSRARIAGTLDAGEPTEVPGET